MLGSFLEVGPEEWEGLERLSEKEKGHHRGKGLEAGREAMSSQSPAGS